jgi:hypothetical protein
MSKRKKTKKITAFDRKACREVSDLVGVELESLAKRLGLQVTTKGGSFTNGSYTLKVEFAVKNKDGTAKTREAEAFSAMASAVGLDPADLGATFNTGGKVYTITGLKTRARKRPIQTECEKGRTYVWPASLVATLLKEQRS